MVGCVVPEPRGPVATSPKEKERKKEKQKRALLSGWVTIFYFGARLLVGQGYVGPGCRDTSAERWANFVAYLLKSACTASPELYDLVKYIQ